MPTDYSNFTNPDDEKPTAPVVHHSVDSAFGAVWGNRTPDTVNGVAVPGSSGVDQDVNRYRQMAQQNVAAPTVDQSVSDQSRGVSMGALGMLGLRASGEMTPAQQLAQQNTMGAVNAVQSGAASVHGGAMARAAAGRNAIAQGARVQALGDQDQQALRAREMADAAGQYFGAAQGQRGLDLGVAQSNAGLAVGQRQANNSNNQFYEGLGFDTTNAQQQAGLGLSLSDQAATNSARQSKLAGDTAAWDKGMTIASGAAGTASGAAAAYGKTSSPTPAPAPAPAPAPSDGSGESGDWSDYNRDNDISDERAKTNIKPVSDAEAARLSKVGDGMLLGMRAGLASGPAVHDKTAYDGKYLGSPFEKTERSKPAAAKQSLDDAIGARVAQDMAESPRYGYFDEDEGGSRTRLGGSPGYAESRVSQSGGMFGTGMQATHGFEQQPHDAARVARDREVMLSDDRTKLAAAWHQGHQAAIQDVQKLQAKRPEDLRALSDSNPLAGAVRDTKAGAFDEGKLAGGLSVRHDQMAAAHADMDRAAAESEARMAARRAERPQDPNDVAIPGTSLPPDAPPPQSGGISNYFGQLAGRARAMIPSDKLAKDVDGEENAMAGANRAMTPSIYSYKPGFAEESGQKRGEKNVGPMAQNMAADPVASVAIVKRPDGYLAIDKDKGLKLVMGGLSDLQRQVDSMKGRRA